MPICTYDSVQLAFVVEISEAPRQGSSAAADTPAYTLTVQLKMPIIFWDFMTAYTLAMLKYGTHQVEIDDMLTEHINKDDNDDDDDDDDNQDVQPEVQENDDETGAVQVA